MKTPSSLAILFLAAALPTGAAAEPKNGARCDAEWLEKTYATMSQAGRTVSDERAEVVSDVIKLKFGHANTCDAATWRHLATVELVGEPILDPRTRQPIDGTALHWRSQAAGNYWKEGTIAHQIGLVLTVNDFYRVVDAKAAEISAAADEVLDAAKALGYVDYKVSEKSFAELSRGTSGGPIGAMKPRVVTVIAIDKQVAAPMPQEKYGPTLRKIIGDGPVFGEAVERFRLAVLGLEAELARMGKSSELAKKRGVQAEGLTDYSPPLPDTFVAIPADKANVVKEKYDSALEALVGPGTVPEFGDQGLRGKALLDPVDLALRNLIKVRSAEVDKIYDIAVKRLNGKTVGAHETAKRAEADGKDATPFGSAALKALAGTREYIKLDELYEAAREKKGLDDPETVALAKARDDLKAAALSTTIETGADGRPTVVFTGNGGRKHALSGIVPPQEGAQGDADRESAAAVVARFIIDEAHSRGAFAAIKAVVTDGGGLDKGGNYPSGVTNADLPAVIDVPPAIAKINAEGAGCKDPRDVYRNNYESYAARKQKAAAEIASGNSRTRDQIQSTQAREVEASKAECEKRKAAASALQADSFTPKAELAALRAAAKAEADAFCVDDLKEIDGRAKKAFKDQELLEKGDRDPNKNLPQANKELDEAAQLAIVGSVSQLRKDYTNPAGGRRVASLMFDAGLQSQNAEVKAKDLKKTSALALVWFMKHWPEGEELTGSAQAERKSQLADSLKNCKAGLGITPITVKTDDASKDSDISYGSPDKPDTVSRKCKIHADLTAFIKSRKAND